MRKHVAEQTVIFFSVTKWLILSSAVGIMIGALMSLFLNILKNAEELRGDLGFSYYFLLPFALMLTLWIVRTFDKSATGHGTEKVIEAVHKREGKINITVIPVKLVATVITIFAGGSVGKEGPGAQIGAGAASFAASILNFDAKDRKKLVICGISAGFASVFGTPIAGAIFGIEVLIIGVIMYDVLLPSFIAGFAAFTTAQFFGVDYTYYDIHFYKTLDLDLLLIGQVVVAGIFFGIVSDAMITGLSKIEKFLKNFNYNLYLKAFVVGLCMVIVSFFLSDKYLGLGLGVIEDALDPNAFFSEDISWYDFIMKIIFTGLTLGAGGSGGVVTPIFYVGATSGVAFGHILGDNVALFAALGFVSVLAGTTNSPIASIIMAVELFGVEMAHYAGLSVVIAFLITGHRSVFASQKIALTKAENIDIGEGSDIEHTPISVNTEDIEKIKNIRSKLRYKRLKWQVKNFKSDKRL
ncbi:MAG TPA: voltage-gated chloride channel [Sulfurospirillum sp. UBA12182]|nr:MAG TPA: voltage-gated chloride channel [Sulfurospirillum sp. UBA12182]